MHNLSCLKDRSLLSPTLSLFFILYLSLSILSFPFLFLSNSLSFFHSQYCSLSLSFILSLSLSFLSSPFFYRFYLTHTIDNRIYCEYPQILTPFISPFLSLFLSLSLYFIFLSLNYFYLSLSISPFSHLLSFSQCLFSLLSSSRMN